MTLNNLNFCEGVDETRWDCGSYRDFVQGFTEGYFQGVVAVSIIRGDAWSDRGLLVSKSFRAIRNNLILQSARRYVGFGQSRFVVRLQLAS